MSTIYTHVVGSRVAELKASTLLITKNKWFFLKRRTK